MCVEFSSKISPGMVDLPVAERRFRPVHGELLCFEFCTRVRYFDSVHSEHTQSGAWGNNDTILWKDRFYRNFTEKIYCAFLVYKNTANTVQVIFFFVFQLEQLSYFEIRLIN